MTLSTLLILSPATITGVIANGDNPANLLTADPRESWLLPAGGSAEIEIDLASVVEIDTIFIGHAFEAQGMRVQLTLNEAEIYTADFAQPRLADRPAHGLLVLDEPVQAQHLTMTITWPAGQAPSIGVLMVGRAFRPTWNMEWGSGRIVIDGGSRTALQGGGFGIDPGARKYGWSWTLGDLSDDELEELDSIALDRGETIPLLVVEDPTAGPALAQRIHYGCFNKLEAWQRQAPGITRWSLGIEDWM